MRENKKYDEATERSEIKYAREKRMDKKLRKESARRHGVLKEFRCDKPVRKAVLEITALGVYEAKLNDGRVGDFILAPGWTSYAHRLQVQSYDVTDLIKAENSLEVTVGQGWRAVSNRRGSSDFLGYRDTALIAGLTVFYADGSEESVVTDGSWTAARASSDIHIYITAIYMTRLLRREKRGTASASTSKRIFLFRRRARKLPSTSAYPPCR